MKKDGRRFNAPFRPAGASASKLGLTLASGSFLASILACHRKMWAQVAMRRG